MAGLEGRIGRLEHLLGDAGGPPPQEYLDARTRLGSYTKALTRSGLGEELSGNERNFVEHYRDSALKERDGQLLERYEPPRGSEDAARTRAAMRIALDDMAEKRREHGF